VNVWKEEEEREKNEGKTEENEERNRCKDIAHM
jgi:hypothetical protein